MPFSKFELQFVSDTPFDAWQLIDHNAACVGESGARREFKRKTVVVWVSMEVRKLALGTAYNHINIALAEVGCDVRVAHQPFAFLIGDRWIYETKTADLGALGWQDIILYM
jgi:hypothetical protein